MPPTGSRCITAPSLLSTHHNKTLFKSVVNCEEEAMKVFHKTRARKLKQLDNELRQ